MSTESHIVHVQGVNELAAPVTESVRELERWEKAGQDASAAFQASADKARASMGVWAQMSDEALSKVKGNFDLLQREWRTGTQLLANGLKEGQIDFGIDQLKDRLAGEERLLVAMKMRQVVMRGEIAAQGDVNVQGQQNLALANMEIAAKEKSIDALRIKIGGYERETIAIREQALELAKLDKTQEIANQTQARSAVSAGQHRAAMQQLGYQLGDVATSFAAGTPPAMIFGQQIGQVTQAVGLLDNGSNAFIKFLGGPWGIAISAAMVFLSPFVAKLWEGEDAANKAGKANLDFTDVLNDSTSSWDEVTQAASDYARQQAKSRDITLQMAQAEAVAAAARLRTAIATREQLAAELALRAETMDSGRSADERIRAAGLVLAANSQIDRNKAAIDALTVAAGEAGIKIAELVAKMKSDPSEKIRVGFEKLRNDAKATIKDVDALARRLATLNEAEAKALKNERENDRKTRAPRLSPNHETGAVISSADAVEIGRAQGWQVNSADRSYAEQKALYDRWVAQGMPKDNPVAKPGTSAHERGNALDIQFKPGLTANMIRDAYAEKGVTLTKVLKERGHWHIEWAKRASEEATAADKAAAEAKERLANALAYNQDERDARHRLLDATRKSATSEAQRDQLLRDDINADASARKDKIGLQQQQGKISAAEAKHLTEIEEQIRTQKLQTVDIERAAATLREATDLRALDLETQISMAQIEVDMADTAKLRQAAELKLLDLKDEHVRVVANAVIADKNASPQEVQGARDTLKVLAASRPQREDDIRKQNASPMEQYKQRLTDATKDMDTALSEVQANGLASLEDGLAGIITGTESVAGAFKKMANSIIADLVRIAVQKLILSALGGGTGGGFLGLFAGGGKIEGKAGGGMIRGPGTGTSDSILALVDGMKPLLVSNGESIVTAEATARYWPLIEAMNKGMAIPGFAGGGFTSALSAPRLPATWDRYRAHMAPVQHFHVNAAGAILAADLIAETRRIGMQAALGGAELAQQRANERAMAAIPQ